MILYPLILYPLILYPLTVHVDCTYLLIQNPFTITPPSPLPSPRPTHSLNLLTHSPVLCYPAPTSQSNSTALMYAARKGDAKCVDLLIEAGSDVMAKNNVRGVEGIGGWA